MKVTDEMLMAYVDGELDDETRDSIAARLASDPDLAARLEAFAVTRRLARAAFEPELSRPVPARLEATVRTAVNQRPSARILRFADRRTVLAALPLAASVALVFAAGGYWYGQRALPGGDLFGSSELARAVGGLPAGERTTIDLGSGDVTLSTVAAYRVLDGTCRVFEVAQPAPAGGMRGVGCARFDGDWTIDLVVSTAGADAMTPASEGLLGSIDAYLDALEAEPLPAGRDAPSRN